MQEVVIMTKNRLFYNIDHDDQLSMMHCFNSIMKEYSSGEIICFYSEQDMGIGIIESGNACVVQDLPSGSRTILETLGEGDIFGQLFYFHSSRENIIVEATSDCAIRYINYEHLVKRCKNACAHHSQLVSNVLEMVQEKAQRICEHLEVLSQRSTRERLLTYFRILAAQSGSDSFTLPFTISNLADYLSVDRSAMSRELGKMKKEGLISMDKRKIKLLQ